jgi:hypothetical protein
MKLSPGATGFSAPSGEYADLREFTTLCHHAARTHRRSRYGCAPWGFSRGEYIVGRQAGCVLVRSLWRADVALDPWRPRHGCRCSCSARS